MASINLGRIGMVLKGEWNSEFEYDRLDVVLYEGSSYAAIEPNKNKNPATNTAQWILMAQKGDKGDKGNKGDSIEFAWDGVELGVRIEGQQEYHYVDLKGDKGEPITDIIDNGDGTLTIYYGDGQYVITSDLTGPKGEEGEKGEKGEKGDKPAHNWSSTQLRFENPDGTWGNYVNLKGDKGETGEPGGVLSVNQKTGNVTLDKSDVDLENVTNDKQATKAEHDAHLADYTLQIPFGGTTTNSGNNYSIASPGISSLVAGMAISVKINADSTGASTLNWGGKGAKPIKKANGSDVTNLKANGIYTLRYDGLNFILQGEGGSGNATASDLLSGKTASTDAGDIVGTLDEIPTKSISSGSPVPLFIASHVSISGRGCIGEDKYAYIPDSACYINQLSLPDMTRIARLSYPSNRTMLFIGVAANGNIYYTLGNPATTTVIGRKIDGTAVTGISGLPSVATTAREIAVNGNQVYIIWGSKLIKLDATTGDYIQVEVPYNLYQGIVVNGEGDLYLGGENRLTKVKGDDLSIVWDSIKTNEFKSTNDLAIDLNGNLYFWHTDSYSRKRFSKYDPSGDLVFNVIDDAASAALIGRDYLYTIASSTYNLQARDFSDYSVVYEVEDNRLTSDSSVSNICRQNRDFDNLLLRLRANTSHFLLANFINYLKIIVD